MFHEGHRCHVAVVEHGTNSTQISRPLSILHHELAPGAADGELLTFADLESLHEIFGDVDVVTFPAVLHDLAHIFFHMHAA